MEYSLLHTLHVATPMCTHTQSFDDRAQLIFCSIPPHSHLPVLLSSRFHPASLLSRFHPTSLPPWFHPASSFHPGLLPWRSEAIKLSRFSDAVSDCNVALKLEPTNTKGKCRSCHTHNTYAYIMHTYTHRHSLIHTHTHTHTHTWEVVISMNVM